MIKKQTATLLLLISSTLVHWNNSFAQPFKFTKTPEGISLTEGTHPIYFYQQKTKSLDGKYPRANYLHPLYGLNDEVLTEDFPADHLHQRGIFWAWHQLIVDGERIGDGWECKGIEWKVTNTNTNVSKKSARLELSVDWNTIWQGDSITFVKENTVITTYKTTADYREMDFDISLTAVGHDVWIGGSEDHKGYSGFSARTILPDDVKFLSEKGDLTPHRSSHAGGSLGRYDCYLWGNKVWIHHDCGYDPDDIVAWLDTKKQKEHAECRFSWPGTF